VTTESAVLRMVAKIEFMDSLGPTIQLDPVSTMAVCSVILYSVARRVRRAKVDVR